MATLPPLPWKSLNDETNEEKFLLPLIAPFTKMDFKNGAKN